MNANMSDETTQPAATMIGPRDVECPRCGAKPGQDCELADTPDHYHNLRWMASDMEPD